MDSQASTPGEPEDASTLSFRIPPTSFGISFGLAGLAEVWGTSSKSIGTPKLIADILYILTALAWCTLLVLYFRQGSKRIVADMHDTVVAPFIQLIFLIGMLLGAALFSFSATAGQILTGISIGSAVLFGGWLTGQWILQGLDISQLHPGYFLPTVAGGFLSSATAAQVGWHTAAEALFGIGTVCWLLVGSVLLNRLFFLPMLPPPLIPSLALESAPPAVAGYAYFAITDGKTDMIAYGFFGYTALMILVQMRFITIYVKQKFSAAFWSFTFSYAAVITYAIEWLGAKRPDGYTIMTALALTLISSLIATIAVRSAIRIGQGSFFPKVHPVQ
ncbi:TDT family transporter [Streptomyces sp. 049-1]|uniref:SLAC1 family transporter n=1 Tax=Streptomyces sp. 049-1 TaxID=2789264 RepID=UPI00397E980E